MTLDLKLLQGSWKVTALEFDGHPVPDATFAEGKLVIDGHRFTAFGMGADYQGRLELDDAIMPKHLSLHFESGPEKGNHAIGIYELVHDDWRFCLAVRGGSRPAIFGTTPGSGIVLESLVRERRSADRPRRPTSAPEPRVVTKGGPPNPDPPEV